MAKGSVRKKGKKWYYRFYVEDASGILSEQDCRLRPLQRNGTTASM